MPSLCRKLRFLLFCSIAVTLANCQGTGTSTPGAESLCGTVPYPSNTGNITPSPILDSPQVWSFVSAPDLHPMKVKINTNQPGTAPGLILVDPFTPSSTACYGQPGALILDNDGNPIWFRPLNSPDLMINNLETQALRGKPVLTFWQGTIATPPTYTNLPGGGSEPGGCYYIMDDTYRVIKTVRVHNGFDPNFHDFLITPTDTALFIVSKTVPMDLTSYGGPQNGYVYDFAIQEVDLRTNQTLFFWDALDHIPLTDSYQSASTATESSNVWDPFHLNSVGLTDDPDDILVSGRATWTIYRINKPTGKIVWQLGGVNSSFTIESGADFSWQHDARWQPGNVVSLFDDGCCQTQPPPGTPPSHGLFVQLNFSNMTASVATEYYHQPSLVVPSQGSTQSLVNGDVFVGWGALPYYSEYAAAGNNSDNPSLNTLYDAAMPGGNSSYRAFRRTWIGRPYYPPSVAVKSSDGQTTVYISWNGSTETARWQVLGGSGKNRLQVLTSQDKSGFETAVQVPDAGPYFQVKALDATGKVIGASDIVKLSE